MRKAPTPSTVNGAFQDHHQRDDFTPNAQKLGNPEPSIATDSIAPAGRLTLGEAENPDKTFATLRAQFALRGHRLERNFHADDTTPTYYAERWGMVRWLPTLHDAAMFLARLGGRL